MRLEQWADDLMDLIKDFVSDTRQDIESGAVSDNQTDQEWWHHLDDYREATGS